MVNWVHMKNKKKKSSLKNKSFPRGINVSDQHFSKTPEKGLEKWISQCFQTHAYTSFSINFSHSERFCRQGGFWSKLLCFVSQWKGRENANKMMNFFLSSAALLYHWNCSRKVHVTYRIFHILLTTEINFFLCQLDWDVLLPSKPGGNLFSWSSQWKAHPRHCPTACSADLCPTLWGQETPVTTAVKHQLSHRTNLCVSFPKVLLPVLRGVTVLVQALCSSFQKPDFSWNNRRLLAGFPCLSNCSGTLFSG